LGNRLTPPCGARRRGSPHVAARPATHASARSLGGAAHRPSCPPLCPRIDSGRCLIERVCMRGTYKRADPPALRHAFPSHLERARAPEPRLNLATLLLSSDGSAATASSPPPASHRTTPLTTPHHSNPLSIPFHSRASPPPSSASWRPPSSTRLTTTRTGSLRTWKSRSPS